MRREMMDRERRRKDRVVEGMPRVLLVLAAASAFAACTSFGTDPTDTPPEAGVDASPPSDAGTDGAVPSDANGEIQDASIDVTVEGDAGPCEGEPDCPRFVFVTSESFSGEDLGGAISADQKCTARAALPSTLPALRVRKWRAWISEDDASRSASARLTHGTRPYRLPNGTIVATDWVQLTSGALLHAIDRDEMGAQVGQEYVWTGTQTSGQVTPANCTNWTIGGAANKGTVGLAHRSDAVWTNAGVAVCGSGHRLYCFEQ
jgi:hypothetical protein